LELEGNVVHVEALGIEDVTVVLGGGGAIGGRRGSQRFRELCAETRTDGTGGNGRGGSPGLFAGNEFESH